MKERGAVVIDNGSCLLKAGLAGAEGPSAVFLNAVGYPRYHTSRDSMAPYYVGKAALAKRSRLKMKHPIRGGVVTNWEQMEKIWTHTFKELRVEHSGLMRFFPSSLFTLVFCLLSIICSCYFYHLLFIIYYFCH